MSILDLFPILEQERVRQGISIDDLCVRAGISQPTYYALRAGRSDPRLYTISCIMDALGYEVRIIRKRE